MTELKNNTVRFPLTRPSAWFLAKLWKQTADQLADLEQSKRIEVFSASFWFLDQIGQHGDLKEPGICLTFSFLYQSFLDDKSVRPANNITFVNFSFLDEISCQRNAKKVDKYFTLPVLDAANYS